MGHRVTIEGSRYMPTDLLGRGQRATVEVTDTIRKLVARGGAIVVAGSLDDPDAVAYGAPEAVPAADPVEVVEPEAESPAEQEPQAPQRRRRSSSGDS